MAVSPKNAYFARLDAVCVAHNCEGHILIQGVGRDEDEEEEEEEEEEEAEEVRSLERLSAGRNAVR